MNVEEGVVAVAVRVLVKVMVKVMVKVTVGTEDLGALRWSSVVLFEELPAPK